MSQTMTLLDTLPEELTSAQIVARVEIVEVLKPSWPGSSNMARVRVVEPIKGVAAGQTFKVDTGGTDCDQFLSTPALDPRLQNWRPYIAGTFVSSAGEAIFRGAWREKPSGGYIR
jgi:hypothetical protein